MIQSTLDVILQTGIVAILRADRSENLLSAIQALKDGGVRAVEVTITSPDALPMIVQARSQHGDSMVIGVGTILDPESARAAILAGAQFVVTPTLNHKTIELCRRYSIPIMPGSYTPTEVLTAWEAGADLIKLFPAEIGGAAYLKAIKAPLPQVRIAPTGGVDEQTAADFLRAGASALGVGSALVNQKLLDAQDFTTITERANRLRQIFDAHHKARG
jgi:2-dehydro-3-deoxyphosphogluconate aldolase/(4S)-4-hydroxy-2-oxoglutarate aldolase